MEYLLTELVLSMECFPRLSYAARNMPRLENRYIEIMQIAGIEKSKIPKGRNLDLIHAKVFYKNIDFEKEEILSAEEMVLRNSEKIRVKSTNILLNQCTTLKAELNRFKASDSDISLVITNSKMKDELYELNRCDHYIVHVARSLNEVRELTKEFELRNRGMEIVFTTRKLLSNDINNLLEKIAYEPLKSVYEVLKNVLHANQTDQQHVSKKRRREFQNVSLSAVDKERVEYLCEEILALYEISNVPEQQRPKSIQHTEYLITKEMRDDIFKRCPTVEALGFHFNDLRVYVRDNTGMAEKENEIKKVMENHSVSNYCITTLSRPFIELMDIGSAIGAGAEGIPVKKGSIGCFADMESGQTSKTCLLLSKHVAQQCKEIYLFENATTKLIADVIETTTEHEYGSLDIAAAQIKDDVMVEKDDRKLKDSEGNRQEGRLCENSMRDRIIRNGRKVHIWGSKSKPGYGVITDTQYFKRGMAVSLIQIKDEEGYSGDQGRPFATEGDSGSIVCSDDPCDEHVNALAMLMGQVEGKYLSLPLKDGVQQLETKTNKKFKLF